MSEYNILNHLQQMTMAANAYTTQIGTPDKAIAELLIAGFSGQLKGWWDYHLTPENHLEILNSIREDEEGKPILDEQGNPIQGAVAQLILVITHHFIGDPSHLRDKNAELLHNLKCKKLSDFQRYKTTFLTRVMLREDSNHANWKENFLAGLPTLLGERVRTSLITEHGSPIPYKNLTYGQLISQTQREGLKICQDLKLQRHLKWEMKITKQELGTFCQQFDYNPNKSYSKLKCDGECKPYQRPYQKRSFTKSKHFYKKSTEPFYNKPSSNNNNKSSYNKKPFNKNRFTKPTNKDITCYKCGKKGHISRFCRLNRKIQELNIEESLSNKISALLLESSDSETSEMSGNDEPLQIDEIATSSSSSHNSSSEDRSINVLTRNEEHSLEIIEKITDPQIRKELLEKLLQRPIEPKPEQKPSILPSTKTTYDLTTILKKQKPNQKSVPTIQDLHKEIKEELKILKE